MTFQCPKCELRFTWQTELDDHCRNDHPDFHHDYPAGGLHQDYSADTIQDAVQRAHLRERVVAETDPDDSSAILRTYWNER